MVELKQLVCPKCGAQVKLERNRDRGTCTYCGTVAYVQNPRRQHSEPAREKRTRNVARAVVAGVFVVATVGFGIAMTRTFTAPPAPPKLHVMKSVDVFTPRQAEPATPPQREPTLRVLAWAPARLIDADGDKRDELVLPVERALDGERSVHFATFSLPDGKLRSQTPALTKAGSSMLSAVAYGRLVVAQSDGQLTGFDLASGAEQWTSTLGERVAALCAADAKVSDAIQVVSDDQRNLLIDVKTGRQTPTKHECKVLLAVNQGSHAPSDRRDWRAPPGVEAWLCGGVRVMGSQNYEVPDACMTRLHIDTDRLDGMVGHAVWRVDGNFLIFGVRKPGTYVPSVGLYARNKKWLWKSEVPAQNPLDAETGGPRIVSLQKERLLIAYDGGTPRKTWVTHFDVRDGTRRWSLQLPQRGLTTLVQNDDVAVAQGDPTLVLSPADGSVLATLGVSE